MTATLQRADRPIGQDSLLLRATAMRDDGSYEPVAQVYAALDDPRIGLVRARRGPARR